MDQSAERQQAGQATTEQRSAVPPPPNPEIDSRVEAYIHKKSDEIAEAFENPTEFLQKFNDFQKHADAVENIEIDDINSAVPLQTAGDPLDEATPSTKNQELQTNIWVNKTLDLLGRPAGVNTLNVLNVNDQSKKLLEQLRNKLSPFELRQGTEGLPIVYRILGKILNNQVNNPLTDVLSDIDFGNLAFINPRIHRRISDAIITAATNPSAGREGMREVTTFRKARAAENSDINSKSSQIYTETELLRLFSGKESEENQRAKLFYNAIKDGNIDDFINFYEDQVRSHLATRSDANQPSAQEQGMTRELAEKDVTEQVHKTILYMVNSIFSTTLDRAPDEDFDKVARNLGSYAADPIRVFEETIAGNLSRLADNAQKFLENAADKRQLPANFFGFKRDTREYYSEATKRIESTTVPMAELQNIKLDQYINSLREIAEVERGALRYQFNFGYLMRNPPGEDKGGLFGSIASYSKSLQTETIDSLNILPYNEIIQAAVIGLEGSYKRLFAKHDWRKTTDLESDVFDNLPKAERQTLDHMLDYFSKKGVPTWAIKRGFYHARLMSFGKEFSLQLMSSYADPNLTDTGAQTYLGEGIFAKNSAFDIWDGTKRWGSGADLYLMGLPFMPANKEFDQYHPQELKAEGEKRWSDSFTHGKMAYFDHKDFRESQPLIAMHNFSEMGGVDAYGGWRLKYAYAPWMAELIDDKSHDFNFSNPDSQAFVKGWKSIENIGTYVLKNYMDSFLLSDDSLQVINGNFAQEAKYEELFKFIYRRYFQKGVGKAMIKGISSDAEYWQHMKQKMMGNGSKTSSVAFAKEQINETVHNAMTVELYERLPMEFFTMEKVRSSQNGVTLRQELIEEFVGSEERPGRWLGSGLSQDQIITAHWEVALDDITFVQQIARMESIEEMRKRQQESTDKNKLGILYGDLNNDESEIRYRVDEESIDRILRDRYQNDPDMEGKVSRAKEVYTRMTEKMMIKPHEGEREKQWREAGDMKTYTDATNSMQERVKWFSKAWETGDLGMQFTSDIAGQFLNRSATGEELISRTAEAIMWLTQSGKSFVQEDLYGSMTDAVRKGREGWGTAVDGIKKFYEATKNEDKDRGKKMVKQFVNWVVVGMRRDTRYESGLAKLSAQLEKGGTKRISLAGVKVGEGAVFDWDKQDVFDFIAQFVHGNILPKYTPKDEIQYKEVMPSWIEKVKAAISGREPVMGLERDYANELSGDAARKMHQASGEDLVNKNWPSVVGIIAIAILYALLEEALDDD